MRGVAGPFLPVSPKRSGVARSVHLDVVLADPDGVAVVESGAFDAEIVDERAVEAGEIFDNEAPGFDIDARVIVRHGQVIDGEDRCRGAADADRASSDGDFLDQSVFEHKA